MIPDWAPYEGLELSDHNAVCCELHWAETGAAAGFYAPGPASRRLMSGIEFGSTAVRGSSV